GRISVPQAGHCVGMTKGRSLPSRVDSTGPRISGITSPALRSTIVSPISTPLRSTSNWLCRVAFSTVEPATVAGSMIPKGGDAPGAAHLHLDVQQLRGDLLRRELHRGRPAGGTGGGAQRPLLREGI